MELAEQVLASEERVSATARQLQASEAQLASQQEALGGCRTRLASAEARAAELCVLLAESQHAFRAAEARTQVLEAELSEARVREAGRTEAEQGAGERAAPGDTEAGVDVLTKHTASLDLESQASAAPPEAACAPSTASPAEAPPSQGKENRPASPTAGAQGSAPAQDGGTQSLSWPDVPSCPDLLVPVDLSDIAALMRHARARSLAASSSGWTGVSEGGPREVRADLGLGAPQGGSGARRAPPARAGTPRYGQLPAFQDVKVAYDAGARVG